MIRYRFKFPIIYLNLEALKMEKPKQLKAKKCRACTFPFHPRVSTQVVCSPLCALKLNKMKKEKAFDQETRKLKSGIKTRGDYTAEAQTSINCFVRLRDVKDPCISCGRFHGGRYDAGHFLPIGSSPEIRFNLWNINKQCHWNCNIKRGGNQIEYRKRLVKKIGINKVEWLEGPHDALKYTIEDLKRVKRIFNRKTKILKAKLS